MPLTDDRSLRAQWPKSCGSTAQIPESQWYLGPKTRLFGSLDP